VDLWKLLVQDFFYWPDALTITRTTVSMQWRIWSRFIEDRGKLSKVHPCFSEHSVQMSIPADECQVVERSKSSSVEAFRPFEPSTAASGCHAAHKDLETLVTATFLHPQGHWGSLHYVPLLLQIKALITEFISRCFQKPHLWIKRGLITMQMSLQ